MYIVVEISASDTSLVETKIIEVTSDYSCAYKTANKLITEYKSSWDLTWYHIDDAEEYFKSIEKANIDTDKKFIRHYSDGITEYLVEIHNWNN